MTTKASRNKSYACEECGQVLSRLDHLERHRVSAHTEKGSFNCACTECGRKFSRRDVLLRHYRVLHGIHCEPRPKGRPKRGTGQKERLANSRSTAPQGVQRDVDNSTSDGLTIETDPLQPDEDFADHTDHSEDEQRDTDLERPDGLTEESTADVPDLHGQTLTNNIDSQWELLLSTTASNFQHDLVTPEPPIHPSLNSNKLPPAESAGFGTDFFNATPAAPSLWDGSGFPFTGLDFDQSISLLGWMNAEDPTSADVGMSGFSIPDISMDGFDEQFRPSSVPQYMQNPVQNQEIEATAGLANASNTSTKNVAGSQDAEMSLSTAVPSVFPTPTPSHDTNTPSSLNEVPDPVSLERASNTWPYEHQDETSQEERIALPVLGPNDLKRTKDNPQDGGSSGPPQRTFQLFSSFGKLDNDKRTSIIQLLSLPLARVPWQEDVELLRSLPGPDVLHHFTDLYFLHFHDLWPIIHQPTFKVSEAPTILILSMACIGACYSGLEKSIEFADALAELCRRASSWMGEHDPRFLRSPSYGIALLLQHIHALGSGSRRLFDMTDSSRSRLAALGRQMNLANLQASRTEITSQHKDAFESWTDWIRQEELTRLVWFLFEFDCLYSAFSKQPPCLKLEELPADFPCEQIHWDAPTAFAWAACPYQTSPRGPPTVQTMNSFLAKGDKSAIAQLDYVGKRLMVRCLGRHLDACQEQMESQVYGILWEDSCGREVANSVRSRLSQAIMSVYETSRAEHPRRFTLRQALRIGIACHYSHMFVAGRIVDLVTRVARRRAAEHDLLNKAGGSNNNSTSNLLPPHQAGALAGGGAGGVAAATRDAGTRTSFNEDPEGVREMMWHASQVFYLQRRHPFNSPHEPLSVFLSGISLWAFCKYFNPEQPGGGGGVPSIQLDEPSFCFSPQPTQSVKDWIKHGGKTFLEGVGNVQNPDAPRRILQLCVETTRRLRVWKMASNVSEIFTQLLQREDQEFSFNNVNPLRGGTGGIGDEGSLSQLASTGTVRSR